MKFYETLWNSIKLFRTLWNFLEHEIINDMTWLRIYNFYDMGGPELSQGGSPSHHDGPMTWIGESGTPRVGCLKRQTSNPQDTNKSH